MLARNGHPLRHATSLAELVKGNWITTSITDDPGLEFNDLFIRYGLPPPNLGLATESLLTWLLGLTTTACWEHSRRGLVSSRLSNV